LDVSVGWGAGRILRWLGAAAVVGMVVVMWRVWDYEALIEWKRQAGMVPFFLALAVLPAFGVPTTPFYLLAGATFGVGVSLAGSALSLGANLLLCYWIAHSALRPWLLRLLAGRGIRIPTLDRTRAFRFSLLVKLAPGAPTFVKTYLIALAGVPFAIYFVLSFVTTLAWGAGFIVLGESILDRNFSQAGFALGVLAALAVGLTWWVRRRRQKAF
jgi:uncharacterized membrane protein YdjX (TVP38/TMEM64 family)